MSSKYTPGPWKLVPHPAEWSIDGSEGEFVCADISNEADARAIAAVPEMLELLKDLATHESPSAWPWSAPLWHRVEKLLSDLEADDA
jgi:hypothetical protein